MPLLLVRNDITKMKVDAIVNAANSSLLGGGGVDGAIHRAAGPGLLEECRALGGCPTGEAKITGGYSLPARYVIHTVGPIWEDGSHGEEALLRSCYLNSLELAVENHCETVAFPLISAGVYGYPKDQALRVAIDAISGFLMEHDPDGGLAVWLVLFGRDTLHLGRTLFPNLQEFIDDHYVEEHEDEEYERSRRLQYLARKEHYSAGAPDGMSRPPAGASGAMPRPSAGSAARPQEAAPSGMARPDHDRKQARRRPSFLRPSNKEEIPEEDAYLEAESFAPSVYAGAEDGKLDDLIARLDESFTQMLLRKIDEAGITDAQCYKRANLDRKLFSKIRSDVHYSPSKKTVVALAIALRLDLAETGELLRKAGFALSRSSIFDVIIEYFISHGNYNIFEINEALFAYDQVTLG